MPTSTKLKVLVVGPKQSGKSTLTNVMGEIQTTNDLGGPDAQYFPTLGVRIVEAAVEHATVEFWEVSGDLVFKNYWSVLADKANATIFVFPDGRSDDLTTFIHSGVFPQKNALVIQTCNRGQEPEVPKKFPPTFTPLRIYNDDVLAFKAVVSQWVRNYFLR